MKISAHIETRDRVQESFKEVGRKSSMKQNRYESVLRLYTKRGEGGGTKIPGLDFQGTLISSLLYRMNYAPSYDCLSPALSYHAGQSGPPRHRPTACTSGTYPAPDLHAITGPGTFPGYLFVNEPGQPPVSCYTRLPEFFR